MEVPNDLEMEGGEVDVDGGPVGEPEPVAPLEEPEVGDALDEEAVYEEEDGVEEVAQPELTLKEALALVEEDTLSAVFAGTRACQVLRTAYGVRARDVQHVIPDGEVWIRMSPKVLQVFCL